MQKVLKSSVDENKVSLTIKGVGVALIPVIIFIGGIFGFRFVEVDLVELLNSIAILVSTAMVIWGLIRKILVKYRK